MIAVCLKWVDQRPEPDAAGMVPDPDSRFAGVSAADRAALEWALRCCEVVGGELIAITAGPPHAEHVLRDALAAGASRAIRVDMPFGAPSATVARGLAALLGDARLVWCGDFSTDRGTGSVPAYLAGELGVMQALGLVSVTIGPDLHVEGLRRLDGGRRERLAVNGPAVMSVEGSTAQLRRAALQRLLAAPAIATHTGPAPAGHASPLVARPFRPRPRVFAPPAGSTALDRVKALTGIGTAPAAHGETVTLPPSAAAERIIAALDEWGYLP